MVEYKHSLSKGLVRAFVRVVKHVAPEQEFSFSDCEFLTISQATNLHKLRYWYLISKPEKDEAKGGEWLITDLGMDFATGLIDIQPKVWTYRGTVQRFEGEPTTIEQITGGWKYRPDYARESQPHFHLQS